MNKKYHALSVINQVLPSFIQWLTVEYPELEIVLTNGWDTKAFREDSNLAKTHHLDACAIACLGMGRDKAKAPDIKAQEVRQFRRQDRQACHREMLSRKYVLDGKVVAVNRHKAMNQKVPSLAEYREAASAEEFSRLTVRSHPAVYKDMGRVMPGAVLECQGRRFVLARTDGKHKGVPNYYVSTDGTRYPYKGCRLVARNMGLVMVS